MASGMIPLRGCETSYCDVDPFVTPNSPLENSPSLLMIDLNAAGQDELFSSLEASGFNVIRAASPQDATQALLETNTSLVGAVDPGNGTNELLALLKSIKYSSTYRQTLIFTDNRDPDFTSKCLVEHQVDHILPLTADATTLTPLLTAVVRTSLLMGELVSANHQLSRSSKTDSLTGLYNHGHVLEWLRIEHKRAMRDMEPLCAVMIDLDFFKFINDTYGHAFGDFVLAETGQLLRHSIRESDILGRFGGEEYLIVAPNTNAVGGRRLAEKLRREFEEHVFKDEVFDVRLTASFGVATSDHPGASTPEALLQLADKALYEAKERGRNSVVVSVAEGGSLGSATRAELDAAGRNSTKRASSVLLIDNSPLMLEMLGSIIRSMGLNVLTAHEGLEALEIIKSHSPDCVILDVNMPGIDGYQVCRQIKAIYRDTHIPVIFVTSEKGLESQIQGYQSGADDYLTKPVIREHLIAKIEAQLRVKALHDRLKTANAKLRQAQRTLMRAERMRAIGQMATGVAHDFNNVLGSILGHAQVLQARTKDANLLRGLNAIEQLAEDGAKTIDRLQFFSRPDPKPDEFTEIVISTLVDNCLQINRTHWKDEAEKRGIVIEIEKQIEEGLKLRANTADIREVLNILIINAIEAMPQGGKISLTAHRLNNSEILIEVGDTGIGISPDIQRQIFDPFFTTKPETGSGLGLSVALGIVSRLHGKIDVVSKVGQGTTFRITMPCTAPEPEATPVPFEPGEEEARGPATILVIDDEFHIREVFSDILTDRGFKVLAEENGEAGIARFKERHPEIVLTDLGMPGISGWEVVRQIKAIDHSTKVVLTSGWGQEVETTAAENPDIDAVLPKPVSLNALLDCVNRLVGDMKKPEPSSTPPQG